MSGGVDDPTALHRLLELLAYVSGDYKDAETIADASRLVDPAMTVSSP